MEKYLMYCTGTGLSVVLLTCSVLQSTHASESSLLDPRERDEDISATNIQVSISALENGFYEYLYDVESPEENKGRILTLSISAECSEDFGDITFPEPPTEKWLGNRSQDGNHVPLQAYPAYTAEGNIDSSAPSITGDNRVLFGLAINPGESVNGLRILSPAPPGLREYRLDVSMAVTDVTPEGYRWDYGSVDAEDLSVPWHHDFRVSGMIEGPDCRLASEPPPDDARFPGTSQGFGTEQINELLTYSEPLRDRFHMPEGTEILTITIHYHEQIDPETFRVQPAWARRLFNAEPGTSETVELPLRHHRNRFQLEVHPVKSELPRDEDPFHHSFKDKDVFDIRVEGGKTPPGQERNQGRGQ